MKVLRLSGSLLVLAWLGVAIMLPLRSAVSAQEPQLPQPLQQQEPRRADTDNHGPHALHEIDDAMVRLPLAAVLGAALAVGAVIMLVIGASLARAFGIVGAANLIRYRSKIEDPKDAVVMLCALAVGLATGVGLYALSVFSTSFLVAALWVIESFEPGRRKSFDLKIKIGEETDDLRPQIETILTRYNLKFEIRSSSPQEVAYEVDVPIELKTDRITNAILRLDPGGSGSVEWADKKPKGK